MSSQPTEIIEFIRKVQLFSDLAQIPEALLALAQRMSVKSYEKGSNILEEAHEGDELFLLLEGEVGVFKTTPEGDLYRVANLKGSSQVFFGEGGLLGGEKRSATIQALSPCRCLALRKNDFENFAREHPEWALPVLMKITQKVLTNLRKANHDLMLLYNALVSEIRGI